MRLIIFVLFISFRPIASDADLNQRGKSLKGLFKPISSLKGFLIRRKKGVKPACGSRTEGMCLND